MIDLTPVTPKVTLIPTDEPDRIVEFLRWLIANARAEVREEREAA